MKIKKIRNEKGDITDTKGTERIISSYFKCLDFTKLENFLDRNLLPKLNQNHIKI